MRPYNASRTNSPFFQVVAFIIMFTLFLTTTVNASTDDPSIVEQIIIQIYTLIFDNPATQTSTSGGTTSTASTDSSAGTDPSLPPPPPPSQ